jgi:DNA-binding CsgD family transcriptional regulator
LHADPRDVEVARDAGLGVTIHVGEEGGDRRRGDRRGRRELRPTGSAGILAVRDAELMGAIAAAGITLEICPTSNLLTKALPDEDAVRETFRTFVDHGVRFTIATDGPEMMHTHLLDEFELLLRIGALSQPELAAANERGHDASFIGRRAVAALGGRRPGPTGPRIHPSTNGASLLPLAPLSAMQALLDPSGITLRQRQVIELIAQGLSDEEVGFQLGISPRTAKAHSDALRQKLGVPRRRQIPVAFRLLTGEDPLATRLASARADNGG